MPGKVICQAPPGRSRVASPVKREERMAEGTSTSLDARADTLERKMSDELDVLISKSALFNMADGNLGPTNMGASLSVADRKGKFYLMDDDPRLPKMPARPSLLDFFKYRAA